MTEEREIVGRRLVVVSCFMVGLDIYIHLANLYEATSCVSDSGLPLRAMVSSP